jgi:hypothetical protein
LCGIVNLGNACGKVAATYLSEVEGISLGDLNDPRKFGPFRDASSVAWQYAGAKSAIEDAFSTPILAGPFGPFALP